MHKWLWRLIGAMATISLARGLLLWLDSYGIHPDQWVARMLNWATTPNTLYAITWTIVGVCGFLGLVFGPKIVDSAQRVFRGKTKEPEGNGFIPINEANKSTETDEARFAEGYARATYQINASNKDAAILRLTQLRGTGVIIRNEAEGIQDEQLKPWLRRVEGWMEDVISVTRNIDQADAEAFRTLDTVPLTPRVNIGSSCRKPENIAALFKAYREHDYRLVRLAKILQKHGVAL